MTRGRLVDACVTAALLAPAILAIAGLILWGLAQ